VLDELLDREFTPEEVCGACPELLSVVRERWRQIRKTPAAGSGDGTIIIYDAVPGFKAAGIGNSPR
jgi:hypothetical protein